MFFSGIFNFTVGILHAKDFGFFSNFSIFFSQFGFFLERGVTLDIVPPHLYTATVLMIKSLSTGENCSKACFKLLRQATGNISWERIFDSLKRYCEGMIHIGGPN